MTCSNSSVQSLAYSRCANSKRVSAPWQWRAVGREIVNHGLGSHSKLQCVTSMAITCFEDVSSFWPTARSILAAPMWLNWDRLESEKQMEFFLHRMKQYKECLAEEWRGSSSGLGNSSTSQGQPNVKHLKFSIKGGKFHTWLIFLLLFIGSWGFQELGLFWSESKKICTRFATWILTAVKWKEERQWSLF